jgi:phage antirepressor YoqD-like protein
MRDAEGRIPDAAAALQISPRQLFRWLDDKRLGDVKRVSIGRRRD